MSQPTPFDAILNQSRDLCRERLATTLGSWLDGADEAYGKIIEKTEDKDAQAHLSEARDILTRSRADLEKEFDDAFEREFQKRYKKVKKALKVDPDEGEELELELVAEEDLNETLK